MRGSWILVMAMAACVLAAAPATRPVEKKKTVVVELFTSEGCSSCPPADDLLKSLADRQPIPGVEIIALGFHVDYWDNLGCKDPFSTPAATRRQHDYARAMKLRSTYTPQAVVDGRWEGVGSNASQVRGAIAAAVSREQPLLEIKGSITGDTCKVTLQLPADIEGDIDLEILITESGLTTQVRRGENAGHTLDHAPVVRTILKLSNPKPGETQADLTLDPAWKRDELKVVGILRTGVSKQILTAATTRPT